MKKITDAYYYMFYKFYKMSEAAPSRGMSDWKAGLVIIVLEFWFTASILNYYTFFIDTSLKISKNNFFTIGVIFCIINYFAFIHTNKWKAYIIKFDRLPPNKNKLGGWAVFLIAIFVVANLIFSFYLIYQIPRPR